MLNEKDVLATLDGLGVGSVLFVSYEAGREATDRAIQESQRALDAGIASRHFVGTLEAVKVNKKGETYFLVYTLERDRRVLETGELEAGAYRSFNPSLGKLLSLEVVEHNRDCWTAL